MKTNMQRKNLTFLNTCSSSKQIEKLYPRFTVNSLLSFSPPITNKEKILLSSLSLPTSSGCVLPFAWYWRLLIMIFFANSLDPDQARKITSGIMRGSRKFCQRGSDFDNVF